MGEPSKHRGTDIGTPLGTHLHVGVPGAATAPALTVGTLAMWNGSDWVSMDGSSKPFSQVDVVKKWANSIATADNDMIYIRKKNGILYSMKAEVHTTGTWERLDPKDEPVITDVHGKNLEEKLGNPEAKIVDATTAEVKKEEPVIPNIPVGWYQDKVANLYRYEGVGSWDAPPKEWSKLLNLAESGTLEYIG